MTQSDPSNYHSTRLEQNKKRDVLWSVLSAYLQRYVPNDAHVLDFGAGYCGFINEIRAVKKLAYDQWEGIREHAASGVITLSGHYTTLAQTLEDSSLDVVFASNVFEHFTTDELEKVVSILASKLTAKGRLILVQPNYYYAYRRYFDDYTHKSIWTHESLPDFLRAFDLKVIHVKGNFMPLTVKSKLPVNSYLIRAYLHSPFRPMAGQMLIVAEKN